MVAGLSQEASKEVAAAAAMAEAIDVIEKERTRRGLLHVDASRLAHEVKVAVATQLESAEKDVAETMRVISTTNLMSKKEIEQVGVNAFLLHMRLAGAKAAQRLIY